MSPASTRAACVTCLGRKRLLVRVNPGRRVEADCPTCGGRGEIDCCAACGRVGAPELHVCEMACNFVDGDAVCGATAPGSVVTRDRWWARCDTHGGLDAAGEARRADLAAEAERRRLRPEDWAAMSAKGFVTAVDVIEAVRAKEAAALEAECGLCEDEREMEPGTFTPHEHFGGAPPAPPSPAGANAVTTSAELDATARDLFERAAPPAASPGPAAPPTPPITSNKRRRKKPPTSAPAIARRRRRPIAPELPGIPDHHDAPWCGCDRCWERDT